MHPESAFVIHMAVTLIAAGGQYKNMSLAEVVACVLAEQGALDDYFDPADAPSEKVH